MNNHKPQLCLLSEDLLRLIRSSAHSLLATTFSEARLSLLLGTADLACCSCFCFCSWARSCASRSWSLVSTTDVRARICTTHLQSRHTKHCISSAVQRDASNIHHWSEQASIHGCRFAEIEHKYGVQYLLRVNPGPRSQGCTVLQSPVNCLDGKHVGVKTKLVIWHNSRTHDHDALTYKSELFHYRIAEQKKL